MAWLNSRPAPRVQKSYADCSGCNLCLLVCPVWHSERDIRLTPSGLAKALQYGAGKETLASSLDRCSLCGACQPMCPENIDLVGMILDLRRDLAGPLPLAAWAREVVAVPLPATAGAQLLLPDAALQTDPQRLARLSAALSGQGRWICLADTGNDLSLALLCGQAMNAARLEAFLAPLRQAQQIVVADALLLRALRQWLPGVKLRSLGEIVSQQATIRQQLGSGDLYVIEPRAYHQDFQRLVRHYDALRSATGCQLNLDLQRMAIPVSAPSLSQFLQASPDDLQQARWLLQGRQVQRIVVENLADVPVLERLELCPVLHVADLLEERK